MDEHVREFVDGCFWWIVWSKRKQHCRLGKLVRERTKRKRWMQWATFEGEPYDGCFKIDSLYLGEELFIRLLRVFSLYAPGQGFLRMLRMRLLPLER